MLRLRYSAYPPLAERLMREIEAETRARFDLPYCRVVHRVGMLEIGDVAIYCVVRAVHRAETDIEPMEDVALVDLRKQRAALKDAVYRIVTA